MSKKREDTIVKQIVSELDGVGRFFVNNFGSMLSRNGVPDFITHDNTGRFMGIEAKAPHAKPECNQIRRGLEICQSGGRFVIAYDEFDINRLDQRDPEFVEVIELTEEPVIGDTEFDLFDSMPTRSAGCVEIIIPPSCVRIK